MAVEQDIHARPEREHRGVFFAIMIADRFHLEGVGKNHPVVFQLLSQQAGDDSR